MTVNKWVEKGNNFVLGGEKENSFPLFFSLINTRIFISTKNVLKNVHEKVFPISPDLIVLTSI